MPDISIFTQGNFEKQTTKIMNDNSPVLHLLCGKIASGKSTLAASLSKSETTVCIVEDDWLNALYGSEMTTISDFVRCMTKLRGIMGPHIKSLLNAGTSVVLDFQANTIEARQWMKDLFDQTGADHILHVLDVSDDICLARLHARNAQGDHPFAATEEQFHRITAHFQMPSDDEGFNIQRHTAPEAS